VATRAGVSPTTASLILNDRDADRFSEQTRKKVLKAARQLRYRTKSSARRDLAGRAPLLRGRTVSFIASLPLASSTRHEYYYGGILDGIQQEAQKAYAHLVLATGLKGVEKRVDYLRRIREDGIDGCFLAGEVSRETIEYAQDHHIPAVLIDNHLPELTSVDSDDVCGGCLATRHLLELGHRRVVFVGCHGSLAYYRRRLLGYVQALTELGVEYDPSLVCEADQPPGLGEFWDRLWSGEDRPTAVFAGTPVLATRVMEHLASRGIDVPGQVSVVTYGLDHFRQDGRRQLTTIDEGQNVMGALGFRRLLELIEYPDMPPATTLVPPRLVAGDSTAPVSGPKRTPSD